MQRRDGSFDGLTDRTAFGILALRASGMARHSASVRGAAHWLLVKRNRDGGWGNAPGSRTDIDNTGAVLQALAAAGRRGPVARAAARWLVRSQGGDGGFPLNRGGDSNSQSTSYAVLGLAAAGRPPRTVKRNGHTPLFFLTSMQAHDGSFRYNRQSAQTPVWVTAQALLALKAKPLPLRPAARRKARVATAADAVSTAPKPSRTAHASGHAGRSAADVPAAGTDRTSRRPRATSSRADRATGTSATVANRLGISVAEVQRAPVQPLAARAVVRRDDGGSSWPWVVALASAAALAAYLAVRRFALRR
jgi:hypothetical protein